MSQQRARKPLGVREAAVIRTSVAKASGDPVVPSTRSKVNERSRSKNKIPKSIRYDLENALVGLCDVWFEDIKPHLIRNNIKLHVDGMGAIGLAGCNNGVLPSAAPGCSHLDPGAAPDRRPQSNVNYASCCSMRRTVSKAQCPRQTAGAQTYRPPSPGSALLTHNSTSQIKKSKQRSSKIKPNKRQSSAPVPSRSNSIYLVPRACHTCSFRPSSSRTQLSIRIPDTTENQLPSKYYKNNQVQSNPKFDNNRDTHTSAHIRPKNITFRDEGHQIDPPSKITYLCCHQKNSNRIKMGRSPDRGRERGSVPGYSQKCKCSDHNTKEKADRISNKLFGSITDVNERYKHESDHRLQYEPRKISSSALGLCLNHFADDSGTKMQATRCSVCRIQNSDGKIQYRRRSKSQRNVRQDGYVVQNVLRLDRKSPTGRNSNFRIKKTQSSMLRSQNELYLESKRFPVSEIQNERCFDDEDELDIQPQSKVLQSKSSHTNAQEASKTKSKVLRTLKQNSEETTLFDSSLIDIIAKQQDKRVQLLHRNPAKYNSTALNLATGSPRKHNKKARHDKKNPPWK